MTPRPLARAGLALVAAAALAGCDALAVPSTPSPPTGATGSPTAPSASFVRPTPTPFPTAVVYVVRTGDSLTSIARRYATTPRSIALWNRAAYPSLDPDSAAYRPDRLDIGWRLAVVPGVTYDEAADASASPDGSPSVPDASIVVPPGPTPRPDGVAVFLAHAGRSAPVVALTFELTRDDAGATAPVAATLDLLAGRHAPATVFLTPTVFAARGDAVDAVLRRADGTALALGVAGGTSASPALGQGLAGAEAVAASAGRTTRPWYRPASDAPTDAELTAAGRAGWAYAIGWDVDATGLGAGPDVAARVLSRVAPGSIVRLSLGDPAVVDALPAILDGLADRGLVPVTVGGLLGR